MVKPKITLKNYWSNNSRFADLFNQVVFNGKEILTPDKLSEIDIDESLMVRKKDGTEESVERYRDVIKSYNGSTDLVVLGIENQSYTDLMMPVRNMLYDSLNYTHQCESLKRSNRPAGDSDEFLSGIKRGEKIRPVICLVLYYGENHDWDGPKQLSDMMNIPEDIRPYFNDYKINIVNLRSIDIPNLRNEDNKNFFSISQYLYKTGKNFELDDFIEAFPNLELNQEIVKAIGAATGSNKLMKIVNQEEGEVINMCEALRTLENRGVIKGRAEGKAEGKAEGRVESIFDLLSDIGEVADELRKKIMSESSLPQLTKWLKLAARSETIEDFILHM